MPLLPYQIAGGDILAQYDRFGLHDEMGVGKTATIVRAVDNIKAERGIVVAPAMVREHWLKEFRTFSDNPYRICKAQNVHDFVAWKRGRFNFLVTSYELATKWADEIKDTGEILDFVVFDEAHYLKNSGTNRTKRLLGKEYDGDRSIIEWACHVWHVTGTPMANDPLDIYTFLSMCRAVDMTENQFIKTFFIPKPGAFGARMKPKLEMVPALQQLITNNSIRRTKKGVGMQIPPIFLRSFHVDGDTDDIRAMLREHPGLEASILGAVEAGGLSFLDAQYVATLRRLVGEAKAIPYAALLYDELMYGGADKRVVFGLHKTALLTVRDYLWARGINCVLVNGDTSEKNRMQYVAEFQENPNCRVFIGNMRAAGVGITLTAACEIDILESDWSPAGNAQAIMRVHRLGQTRKVHGRFITLAKSIDEVVNRVVVEKTSNIAHIEGEAMVAAPLDELAAFL